MPEFKAPGTTLGIIGQGVIAYKLAKAARTMGMRTIVMAPSSHDLAMVEADATVIGGATDAGAIARVASAADVITFTNEMVSVDALTELTTAKQLPSGTDILTVTQDRYLEKVFFEDQNLNILPYAQVVTANDIEKAVEAVGFPAILKPIQKAVGSEQQLRLTSASDVARAKLLLQQRPYILEAWLDHPREFAVMVAKSGEAVEVSPVIENELNHHQLRASIVSTDLNSDIRDEIQRIGKVIAGAIHYNGVFEVELFMTEAGALYVKRLFPGPQLNTHILLAATGQSPYLMHLRAVLGWPLPTMPLLRSGVVLPLREDDREATLTQIRIKPEWQFELYPKPGTAVFGQAVVMGPLEQIKYTINATDHFKMGRH